MSMVVVHLYCEGVFWDSKRRIMKGKTHLVNGVQEHLDDNMKRLMMNSSAFINF